MPASDRLYFPMKIIATGIFLFAFFSCKTKQGINAQTLVTISGTVTQTSSHCGGAAPSDELIAELETPKPYPGKKMHIIKGDTNLTSHKILLSFIADENGTFSFQIAPGIYSVILDEQATAPNEKLYKTKDILVDTDCYNKWWGSPYYVLNISSSPVNNLTFNFHKQCFISYDIPCLRYNGLPPP